MVITPGHQHTFIPSPDYKDYEVCTECGTYHSTALALPDDVYINRSYWDEGDGTTGRSTWDQQRSNFLVTDDCGISKCDRILQFVPKRGRNVLEIAPAPGILLEKLLDLNYDVYGIEPRPSYCEKLANTAKGAKIICGYFPEVTKTSSSEIFSCIVGADIFEHIDDYHGFLQEIKRLLIPGGTAILMSPIIDNEDGFLRKRDMMHPNEHAWIFTQRYIEPYLKEIFSKVEFKNWIPGHTLIILNK